MIEDALMDPAAVGASREEQRRRILLALEAPLPVHQSPTRPVHGGGEAERLERRIAALQRRYYETEDLEQRVAMREQLQDLTRRRNTLAQGK